MIRVDHLTRRYGGFTAVDDVSFRISRGEIVGLLGHNGAGKTTIMKMLTGYLEPTSGSIQIAGLDMRRDRRAIQARIGYLPENCPAWPEMAVIDYLDYQASLHGVPTERRAQAVAAAIRRTGLKDKASNSIQTLSRGYRQRVGVAQALLHQPDIVILDEPTNGLDPTQIRQMRTLIRELAETATVIVSTHILQEVQAVCERVLILRAGHLVVDARLDELQRGNERLLVSVDGDAQQALSAAPGVGRVEERASDDDQRHYVVEAGPALAPVVARAVQAAGLNLYGLQLERRDLEAVFAEVNAAAPTPYSSPKPTAPQTRQEAAHA